MFRVIVTISLAFFLTSCGIPELPYDENANANEAIKSALLEAKDMGKFVLLEFGANWCGDCISLNQKMKKPPLKDFIDANFGVVKVDIGEGEKNQALTAKYGAATNKGIPTVVVVDQHDSVVAGTTSGQLASARNMGEQALVDLYSGLLAQARGLGAR